MKHFQIAAHFSSLVKKIENPVERIVEHHRLLMSLTSRVGAYWGDEKELRILHEASVLGQWRIVQNRKSTGDYKDICLIDCTTEEVVVLSDHLSAASDSNHLPVFVFSNAQEMGSIRDRCPWKSCAVWLCTHGVVLFNELRDHALKLSTVPSVVPAVDSRAIAGFFEWVCSAYISDSKKIIPHYYYCLKLAAYMPVDEELRVKEFLSYQLNQKLPKLIDILQVEDLVNSIFRYIHCSRVPYVAVMREPGKLPCVVLTKEIDKIFAVILPFLDSSLASERVIYAAIVRQLIWTMREVLSDDSSPLQEAAFSINDFFVQLQSQLIDRVNAKISNASLRLPKTYRLKNTIEGLANLLYPPTKEGEAPLSNKKLLFCFDFDGSLCKLRNVVDPETREEKTEKQFLGGSLDRLFEYLEDLKRRYPKATFIFITARDELRGRGDLLEFLLNDRRFSEVFSGKLFGNVTDSKGRLLGLVIEKMKERGLRHCSGVLFDDDPGERADFRALTQRFSEVNGAYFTARADRKNWRISESLEDLKANDPDIKEIETLVVAAQRLVDSVREVVLPPVASVGREKEDTDSLVKRILDRPLPPFRMESTSGSAVTTRANRPHQSRASLIAAARAVLEEKGAREEKTAKQSSSPLREPASGKYLSDDSGTTSSRRAKHN